MHLELNICIHTLQITRKTRAGYSRVQHTHTHTRRHLTLAPVQEHMSLLTPLRITVINQTPRCRWNLPNTDMHKHTHTHTHMFTQSRQQNAAEELLFVKCWSSPRRRLSLFFFFFFLLINVKNIDQSNVLLRILQFINTFPSSSRVCVCCRPHSAFFFS